MADAKRGVWGFPPDFVFARDKPRQVSICETYNTHNRKNETDEERELRLELEAELPGRGIANTYH